jgi:hypothetical protein
LITNLQWLPLTLSSALLLLSAVVIYSHQYNKLIDSVWEMSFAFMGLFIGFYMEFGITNIDAFYELCGQGNMVFIAPMTVTGMFIGCNISMFISEKSNLKLPHLLSFNLGMLIGMLVFEYVDNLINLLNASFSMLVHLAIMLFFGHIFYLASKSISYKDLTCRCFNYLRVIGGK